MAESSLTLFVHYYFPVLFCIGVVGNILNLCVLNRRGMRTNTNCFLSALAVADLGFFFSMLPLKLMDFPSITRIKILEDNYVFILWLGMPFVNSFSAASIWLTIAVTAERMIVVRDPLNAHRYLSKKLIVFTIVLIYLAAVGLNLYHFFRFKVEGHICPNATCPGYTLLQVDYESSPITYRYVETSASIFTVLVIILPWILLIVLGGMLVYYLKMSGRFAREENSKTGELSDHVRRLRSRERKVAIMIVVIVTSFMILNFPSGFTMCTSMHYQRKGWELAEWMTQISEISNILVTVNKATNLILYCTASYYFRRHLLKMCGCTRVAFLRRLLPKSYLRASTTNGILTGGAMELVSRIRAFSSSPECGHHSRRVQLRSGQSTFSISSEQNYHYRFGAGPSTPNLDRSGSSFLGSAGIRHSNSTADPNAVITPSTASTFVPRHFPMGGATTSSRIAGHHQLSHRSSSKQMWRLRLTKSADTPCASSRWHDSQVSVCMNPNGPVTCTVARHRPPLLKGISQ